MITAILHDKDQAKVALGAAYRQALPLLADGKRLVVKVTLETRSLAQNRRLWAMLTDISEQVEWHGKMLTPTDWKHVFSSSLKKLEVVPNLDGSGLVALGQSTSKMTKGEMAEMQTLMEAFGAQHDVVFRAIGEDGLQRT